MPSNQLLQLIRGSLMLRVEAVSYTRNSSCLEGLQFTARFCSSREGRADGFENEAPPEVNHGLRDINPAFKMTETGFAEGPSPAEEDQSDSSDQARSHAVRVREVHAGPGQHLGGTDGVSAASVAAERGGTTESQVDACLQSSNLPNERINISKHPPDGYSDLHAMNQYPPEPWESDTSPVGCASGDDESSSSRDEAYDRDAVDGPPKQAMKESRYVDGFAVERKPPQEIQSENQQMVKGRQTIMREPEMQSSG